MCAFLVPLCCAVAEAVCPQAGERAYLRLVPRPGWLVFTRVQSVPSETVGGAGALGLWPTSELSSASGRSSSWNCAVACRFQLVGLAFTGLIFD